MKVSLIIPVYNVADYLLRCLESVSRQTIGAFEVILVDDCGTDDSMRLARLFVEEYHGPITWKIVCHSHNSGLSAARNTGIHNATGDYIIFIDSDDEISEDCLESLATELDKDPELEVSIGGIASIPFREYYNIDLYKTHSHHRGNEWARYQFNKYGQEFPCSGCNKMIRMNFLLKNNLMFKEGILHEDELWAFHLTSCMNTVCFIGRTTYFRYVNPNSIMSSMNPEKSGANWIIIINDILNNLSGTLASLILLKYLNVFLRYYYSCQSNKEYRKVCRRLVGKMIRHGWAWLAAVSWCDVFLYPVHRGRFIHSRVLRYSSKVWERVTEKSKASLKDCCLAASSNNKAVAKNGV